jgi:hypothetical protein
MTTLIAFLPNNSVSPPFQSIVVLDGATYALSVTWNIAGQRWYLSLSDQAGNVTWNGAMIGSPLTANIYLATGIFTTSTILFREDTGNIEIGP